MDYAAIVAFHGHECPGLAMGYRLAVAAMAALAGTRAEDEELVAIVENDGCGVDAIQCLTGCTYGKGNLIFRDHGKQVLTLYSRRTLAGVRAVIRTADIPAAIRSDRQAFAAHLLQSPEADIVSVKRVTMPAPPEAQIRKTVICPACGEGVMESRLQEVEGRQVCIPCGEIELHTAK